MKKLSIVYVIICFAMLIALGIAVMAPPKMMFSEMENRYLTGFPEVTVEGILSGQFQEDFEKACADQFPLRDLCVSTQVRLKRLMGKRDAGGVYFGKDHNYIEKTLNSDLSESKYETLLKVIDRIASESGIHTDVMLVPSHSDVESQLLPSSAVAYDGDRYFEKQYDFFDNAKVLDFRQALQNNEYEVYFKTDHHWTSWGAYIGAEHFLAEQGVVLDDYESLISDKGSEKFLGTLYSKAPDNSWVKYDDLKLPMVPEGVTAEYAGKEHDGIYDMEKLDVKDKYAVYFGGNYNKVTITNPSPKQDLGHLCIIKDSYANSMVPYLIPYYRRIDMVDARYYSESFPEFLKSEKPDRILVCYELSNFITDGNIVKLIR